MRGVHSWRPRAMCPRSAHTILKLIADRSPRSFLLTLALSLVSSPIRLSFKTHFFILLNRSDDSTWFLSDGTKREKWEMKEAEEEGNFPSCRWRYHKMITTTTTIWWVHNWLNIKNCSESSGRMGGAEGWRTGRRRVVQERSGTEERRRRRYHEKRKKIKMNRRNVHLLCVHPEKGKKTFPRFTI